MKKLLTILLSVIFVLTVCTACSTSKQTSKTDAPTESTEEILTEDEPTELVTDDNGETVTETVTDESGETVTQTVTEKITKPDGTTETVTKTVPVTKPVTSSTKTTTKPNNTTNAKPPTQTTTKKVETTTRPPTTTVHTHNWVAITKTEPIYETQTTYEWEKHAFCNGCHMDLTTECGKYNMNYAYFHMEHVRGYDSNIPACPKTYSSDNGYYYYDYVQVPTGTEQVKVGEKTVTTGYKCSSCGATKNA